MNMSQIVAAHPALVAVGAAKLPVKVAFRVAKLLKAIQGDLTTYEECRNKLLKDLGNPTEDGKGYTFTPENSVVFAEQLNNLLAEEVQLGDLPQITLEDLGDITIEPSHLATLDGLLLTL